MAWLGRQSPNGFLLLELDLLDNSLHNSVVACLCLILVFGVIGLWTVRLLFVIGRVEREGKIPESETPVFVEMWFFDDDRNWAPRKIPRDALPLLEVVLDDVVLFLLEVLFDAAAAHHLSERALAKDQDLVRQEDDKIRLRAHVADTNELYWWLLGFGDQVEVIRPRRLRNAMQKTAERMARAYRSNDDY